MSIPTNQKALLLTQKFGPLSLTSDFPVPKPGKDEVLVKVHACGLNPADWKLVKSGMFIEHFPAVMGADIAGDIVQLGEGVEESGKFNIGDKVFFQGLLGHAQQGGYMQYTVTDIFTIAKIPHGVSYQEAATLGVALNSATLGLYNTSPHGMGFDLPTRDAAKGKYSGTPLVVIGGSTSVGQAVLQLAALSGFSPIITTASLKHTSLLQSLGATHVLDRNIPLTKTIVTEITNKPITAVYDAISEPGTQAQALDILESGGQVTLVTFATKETTERGKEEGKSINGFFAWKVAPQNGPLLKELWPHVEGLVAAGSIKPNTPEVIPGGLNGVVEGLKLLEENKVSAKKLVVCPQETA